MFPRIRLSQRWFFSSAHEGNSAYFATVATMAFRERGIPARYVEGYRVGTDERDTASDNDGDVLLGANQAHAWCEIYIQGIGWTPIEVTPGFYNQAIQPDNVVDVGEAYSSGAHENVASDTAVAGDVDKEHGENRQTRFSPTGSGCFCRMRMRACRRGVGDRAFRPAPGATHLSQAPMLERKAECVRACAL